MRPGAGDVNAPDRRRHGVTDWQTIHIICTGWESHRPDERCRDYP
jgi:hypothetical protein